MNHLAIMIEGWQNSILLRLKNLCKTETSKIKFNKCGCISESLVPAISVIAVGFLESHSVAVVILLCIAVGATAFAYSGHFANCIDVAPR